jgi:hypothetical protein
MSTNITSSDDETICIQQNAHDGSSGVQTIRRDLRKIPEDVQSPDFGDHHAGIGLG